MSQRKKTRKTKHREEGVDWPDGVADLYSEADDEWRDAIMQRVYQRLQDQAQAKAKNSQDQSKGPFSETTSSEYQS